MSIAELGSLGEFVGAIAVLITLTYLAVQVRQAKKTLVRQNERNLTSEMVSVTLRFVDSPELPRIYLIGVANWQDLTPEERVVLHAWLWSLFSPMEHATIDRATGLFENEIINVYAEGMLNILRTPGALQWYETNKSLFTQQLQDYIAEMLPKGHRTTFDVFGLEGPRVD